MLAITIMGFMTALLWGSFSRTAQIKQRTEAGQDRVHAARVALMRMTREIEMAYMSNSFNIGLQERRTMFIGAPHADFDELRFSWFGHQRLRADSAESDTAVVMYYTEPDPIDRRAINLIRRETRRLEQKDPKSSRRGLHPVPGRDPAEVPVLRLQEQAVEGGVEHPGRRRAALPAHPRAGDPGLLDERRQR
jgi:hypothetical protein